MLICIAKITLYRIRNITQYSIKRMKRDVHTLGKYKVSVCLLGLVFSLVSFVLVSIRLGKIM